MTDALPDPSKLDAASKRALLDRLLRERATPPPRSLPELHELPERLDESPRARALLARKAELASWTDRPAFFVPADSVARDVIAVHGRTLVNFSTYNYLGLAGDPRVSSAAKDAIDRWGTSCSASRLASGERPVHGELERALARWLGVEACITFTSGHATNVSTIATLVGPRDLVVHDALAHNSVVQGAALSGARVLSYRHADQDHLEALLEKYRRESPHALVVTEGVFSMDGDVPDLPALVRIKRKYRAALLVDEAHSAGVIGRTGRGLAERWGVDPRDVDAWMGTLSKSLASCGGYVAASAALVDLLRFTAGGFVFSAAMTPPNAAAALAALDVMQEEPERVARLARVSELFRREARARGLDIGLAAEGGIVPVIVGDSRRALLLSQRLHDAGVNVAPILSPAVAPEQARLRFFLTSLHSDEQVVSSLDLVARELSALRAEGVGPAT